MSEFKDGGVLRESLKGFEVVKYPVVEGGFRCVIYFSNEEEAAQAIRDFWNNRTKSEFAQRGLKSGMLVPIKHPTITEGDRTRSTVLTSKSEKAEHPGMIIKVEFNGNEGAISSGGEAALSRLGYINID